MINICRWFFLGLYNIFTLIPRYLYIGLMCIIDPKKGEVLKYKGKPIIPIAMISLTLATYFICIFFSSRWYVQRLKINYLANDIMESTKILESEEQIVEPQPKDDYEEEEKYVPPESNSYVNVSYMSTDLNELSQKNPDTRAWLRVNNTNVNYVVVQTNDNEYYLKHDFYKNNNYAGWVYADYRDNFDDFNNNTIIYAHNMTNRTMFGSLIWTLQPSWYTNTDNQYIKLSTHTSNTVWRIFSIYQIKPEVYYLKNLFNDENEHQEFLNTLASRSIYNFGETLSPEDKILTLSTCSDDGTKRMVIHAKMIKIEYN